MKSSIFLGLCCLAPMVQAETKSVYLEDIAGARIQIASVDVAATGDYKITMSDAPFTDHFLSMRPFRCLQGPAKHWCFVPYPYEIERNISDDLTDLEYDFLFVWKGATDYGINMWNGVYYKMQQVEGRVSGTLHEMDMDILSAPPATGDLRPVAEKHLHESDPESHWLPRLVIE
ncbi:hypothetical protein [Ascidiaceihabitans sp.]|uniref:hypothetical protein n=1 Tax=Ascidiaceihabitans sp. TaxID=1872644 RepID=UPI00329908DB